MSNIYDRLCVHYYADEAEKERFLCECLYPLTDEIAEEFGMNRRYITRSWIHGPHFELIYPADDCKDENALLSLCKERIEQYWDENTDIEYEFDAKKYARISKDLKKIEQRKKSECFPVYSDHDIYINSLDTGSKYGEYNSEYEYELSVQYNMEMFDICRSMMQNIRYMNKAQRVAYLNRFLIVTAFNYRNYGILKGYQSYISHSEGFLGNSHKKEAAMYRKMFENFYSTYSLPLRKDATKLIEYYRNDDIASFDSLLGVFDGVCRKYYDSAYDIIENDKKSGRKLWITYAKRKKAIMSRFYKKSNFHKRLYQVADFQEFMVSTEFNAYRLIVNFLYNQTSLMGISSSSRMLSCFTVYHTIEDIYDMSWQRII